MERFRFGVLATVALVAWAPIASAAEIEVQIPARHLLDTLALRAATAGRDCPEVVDAGDLGDAIVAHVEWPLGVSDGPELLPGTEEVPVETAYGSFETLAPVARFPIDLHLRTLDCVYEPGCADPYEDTRVTAWLDYRLTVGPDGVCADYVGPFGALPQGTADAVADQVERFGRPCVDLTGQLDPLIELVHGDDVEDVAMIFDEDADVLVVRATIGESSAGAWQAFLYGLTLDPPDGSARVLVDEDTVRDGLRWHLSRALSCGVDPESCADGVEPTGAIGSTWDPDADLVTATVEVVGATCGAFTGIDIVATSSYDVLIDAPPGPFEMDQADYAVRMLTVLGTDPWTGFDCDPVWEAVEDELDDLFDGLGGSCARTGPLVDCTTPFDVLRHVISPGNTQLWLAPLGFAGTTGALSVPTAWGFDLVSDVPQPLELGGTRATYGIEVAECHASAGYEGLLEMDGGPGQLCPAADLGLPTPAVLNDPLGVYDLGFGPLGDRTYTVHPTPAFWADPYGPVITVWSTAGAATIELPAPLQADVPDGIDVALIRAILVAWLACNPLNEDPPIPGWFDVRWHVDPPPYELVVVGEAWAGATAVLESAQVSADPTTDPELGLTIAERARLTTRWTVSHPRMGRFEFTADSTVPVVLAGTDGLLTPAVAGEIGIAVPRASLPRGVTSMSLAFGLAPGEPILVPATR